MADGVTLVAPRRSGFSTTRRLAAITVIAPNVVFGPGRRSAKCAHPRLQPYRGRESLPAPRSGPYARLRPGADIGEKAKVGNFVE
jgi:bifunctional UDP-N-acetylglucosamine pyrophosphorylase/glucosamine-1-phosphate N-acetyltransferase